MNPQVLALTILSDCFNRQPLASAEYNHQCLVFVKRQILPLPSIECCVVDVSSKCCAICMMMFLSLPSYTVLPTSSMIKQHTLQNDPQECLRIGKRDCGHCFNCERERQTAGSSIQIVLVNYCNGARATIRPNNSTIITPTVLCLQRLVDNEIAR